MQPLTGGGHLEVGRVGCTIVFNNWAALQVLIEAGTFITSQRVVYCGNGMVDIINVACITQPIAFVVAPTYYILI